MDRDEAADCFALFELPNHVFQRGIGEPVAVVRQKHLLSSQMVFHCEQALADVTPDAGVN